MKSYVRPGVVARGVAMLTLTGSGPALAFSCNLAFGSLNLGSYVGTQISSFSQATLVCTHGGGGNESVSFQVRLSPGAGNYAQRQMNKTSAPPDTLPYNLYLDALPAVLNTFVWGDGSGGTLFWSGNFNLNNGNSPVTRTATLWGAIPAGPAPSAGAYQDTVVATILFL
jgi:spore coat protein U-like protein